MSNLSPERRATRLTHTHTHTCHCVSCLVPVSILPPRLLPPPRQFLEPAIGARNTGHLVPTIGARNTGHLALAIGARNTGPLALAIGARNTGHLVPAIGARNTGPLVPAIGARNKVRVGVGGTRRRGTTITLRDLTDPSKTWLIWNILEGLQQIRIRFLPERQRSAHCHCLPALLLVHWSEMFSL
jgi:hypothetical protein